MSRTILLVDDEPYILKSLGRLLSSKGYHVLIASSGQEGLDALEQNAVQVIISDQRMPQMTGAEFLTQVKAQYPEIISMILSAFMDFNAIQDAINNGSIYKFINKPWQNEVLLTFVAEAFDTYFKRTSGKQLTPEIPAKETTNLSNRFSFHDALRTSIDTAMSSFKSFALLHVDIDKFNRINSQLGLKGGNLVLQELANRLRPLVQHENHISRVGNDEYIVLVTEEDKLSQLDSLVTQLLSRVKMPMLIDGVALTITVSVGISLYPDHGDSAELLMKFATMALMRAQETGGNNFQRYPMDWNCRLETPLFLTGDLEQALHKRQFIVEYQPYFTVDRKKIVGVEALVNWQHPTYGLIPAEKFMPLCQQANLIVPLANWVLQTTLQQVKIWQMSHPQLRLSVNLSNCQLYQELLTLIVLLLDSTHFPPPSLEIEVTEMLIMSDMVTNIALFKSLRALGVRLALDHFGTGYSSITYLKQFPFSSLNIDQSFIHHMTTMSNKKTMVKMMLGIGKSLDLELLAKGVETPEELAFLNEEGCDLIQGPLCTAPLSVNAMTELLAQLTEKADEKVARRG